MERTEYIPVEESLLTASLLTVSGGFMDAYSYMCRGQVFANAQTGNILLFGINLTAGNWNTALLYAVPVLAFLIGIAAAEIVRNRCSGLCRIRWQQIIAAAEAVILLCAAFFPQELNLCANSLISLACGAQVETFRNIKGYPAATTMCIGNLRTAVQAFCDFLHTRNRPHFRKSILFLSIITVFTAGAVLGDIAVRFFHEKAIVISSVLLCACFFSMFRKQHHAGT